MKFLCLEFLNSEWYDGWSHLEDRLQSKEWLSEFLAKEFGGVSVTLRDPRVKKAFYELRALLRGIVQRVAAGDRVAQDQILRLNKFMALAEWQYTFSSLRAGKYHLGQVPRRKNWKWVLSAIARSAGEMLANTDLARLKICPNPGCRWVFYDETKGRTRRWCDSTRCGNLDKVRRFRERLRQRVKRIAS